MFHPKQIHHSAWLHLVCTTLPASEQCEFAFLSSPAQQPNAHTFKLAYFQLGMLLYSHIPPHTTKCTVHTYPCTFKYTIKYSNFIDIKLNSYSSPSCIWYTGCIFMGPSPHNTMDTFSRAFNLACFLFLHTQLNALMVIFDFKLACFCIHTFLLMQSYNFICNVINLKLILHFYQLVIWVPNSFYSIWLIMLVAFFAMAPIPVLCLEQSKKCIWHRPSRGWSNQAGLQKSLKPSNVSLQKCFFFCHSFSA